jgi:prolyl-tRNA synthetase
VKLGSIDLIGVPWQVVICPRRIACRTVELKNRRTGERQDVSLESAFARLAG